LERESRIARPECRSTFFTVIKRGVPKNQCITLQVIIENQIKLEVYKSSEPEEIRKGREQHKHHLQGGNCAFNPPYNNYKPN